MNGEMAEIILDKTKQYPKEQNLPKIKQYQRNSIKKSKE